ncbi:hypothetical protein ACFXDE_01780 [Kitasatospora sp. NPDC059408]|uniref:hypothetical protein n=1 Tax=Kitasatospora sp. NPDC059408 TaxID=3346823 RepID=UPI003679EA7D
MTDQPADLLAAAAEVLREHVGYLELHGIRGPWTVHSGPSGYPQAISNVGVPLLIANTFTDPKAPPVAATYIALMHPGVGLALADWLDVAAVTWTNLTNANQDAALAVARAVLGQVGDQ